MGEIEHTQKKLEQSKTKKTNTVGKPDPKPDPPCFPCGPDAQFIQVAVISCIPVAVSPASLLSIHSFIQSVRHSQTGIDLPLSRPEALHLNRRNSQAKMDFKSLPRNTTPSGRPDLPSRGTKSSKKMCISVSLPSIAMPGTQPRVAYTPVVLCLKPAKPP